MKDKEGGRAALPTEDLLILRVAERYHKLPEEIEQMDQYWLSRTLILMAAESEKLKLK